MKTSVKLFLGDRIGAEINRLMSEFFRAGGILCLKRSDFSSSKW